jgi:hypothetical protein
VLALALGGMTRDELLHRMGASEFADWVAFSHLVPFGAEQENWNVASLKALLRNLQCTEESQMVGSDVYMPPRSPLDEEPDEPHETDYRILMAKMGTLVTQPHSGED